MWFEAAVSADFPYWTFLDTSRTDRKVMGRTGDPNIRISPELHDEFYIKMWFEAAVSADLP